MQAVDWQIVTLASPNHQKANTSQASVFQTPILQIRALKPSFCIVRAERKIDPHVVETLYVEAFYVPVKDSRASGDHVVRQDPA